MQTSSEERARPATPPDTSSLPEMREAARECTACHLYRRAIQTVFGEGPKNAPIMLVSALDRQPARQSSDLHFASRASAVKFYPQNFRRKLWQPFIPHRCCGNRMRNHASVNTKSLWPI